MFLISFLDSSLSVYDLCMFISYSGTLLNSFISFNNCPAWNLQSFLHIRSYHLWADINYTSSFPLWMPSSLFLQVFFPPNPLSLLLELQCWDLFYWSTSPWGFVHFYMVSVLFSSLFFRLGSFLCSFTRSPIYSALSVLLSSFILFILVVVFMSL